MAWQKLDSETLTGTANQIENEFSKLTTFFQFIYHCFVTGGNFNNRPQSGSGGSFDTGNNYAYRISSDGGAENTQPSLASLGDGRNDANDVFRVGYFSNITTEEKLAIFTEVSRGAAGSGNPPLRIEGVAKHVQTSVKNDRFRVIEVSSGLIDVDSNLTTLGDD